ncbi:asparaginase [Sneathiella sp. P13V-1]|uniref:asparaginase n=1 Tax=Sneathiella sp. P13V-1 TaxID=2697366 RepID=UPI00187BB09E|nr:asparaginase [Sneathiella sp. P13V-1]MBE7636429.1 asparaginase [Sneathiella sp. P13V-1]
MTKTSDTFISENPLTIDVWRGNMVESRHQVHAVVTDADGGLLRQWGTIDDPVYLRSAIKPVQALPLIESGAADAFSVSEKELSLACASHTGEDIHVEAVTAWLDRIGLSVNDLECGAHWPSYRPAERALAAKGQEPTAANNNCSGKHTGFLTTSVHLGENPKGYINLDHPVQKRIQKILEDFTDLDLSNAPMGIDGCSIPTFGVPLKNAAMAIARFANPEKLGADRAAACLRIQNAIAAYPEMIAGSDRLCTALNGSAKGTVIAKVGAEGVYLAALPTLGLGIAMKTADGNTRGVEAALGSLLDHFGLMTDEMKAAMSEFTNPVLENWNKFKVGKIETHLEGSGL